MNKELNTFYMEVCVITKRELELFPSVPTLGAYLRKFHSPCLTVKNIRRLTDIFSLHISVAEQFKIQVNRVYKE